METKNNIAIESRTEALTDVERMVDSVCEKFAVNQDYYGNILIALTEAVNNAIMHGNKFDPSKSIRVSCTTEPNALRFIVEDEGEGFDFDNLPDPTDPENIEKPNGRGVFLMRHLADEVVFSEEGRRVELNFQVSVN